MSEIKTNPIPIPKPIKYSKTWHSFSNPNGNFQHYLFELVINETSNKKLFKKLESKKHVELIEECDNIKYSDIRDFRLSVSKLPFDCTFYHELDGTINHEQSAYNQRTGEIYIEFSQNSLGIAICRASFIGADFTKICVSPPN